MSRVFKTKSFIAQIKKAGLTDAALCKAVSEMHRGLIDADLGGGVLKKRVALPGAGKSGGARTLLATNRGSRWFFVFGFKKNERANISAEELEALKMLAHDLLTMKEAKLEQAVASHEITEICHDQEG
jgi:hypothetical protein